MTSILVRLEQVSKRFPGVQALDRVSMDVRYGEVHAVIGENGAGKSTLMRILAGAEAPSGGSIVIADKPVQFRSPLEAQRAGIAIVYQELSVFPNLSIAENIFANRQPDRGGFIRRGQLAAETRRLLDIFALDLDPDVPVRNLAMADRQMVEILRAVSLDPKLLILDEPTSSLALAEVQRLFQLVDRLRQRGIAVLYVSHQLQEVLRLSDRITVLRDGIYVGTVERAQASEGDLVHMMVGRALDLYKDYGLRETSPELALKVDGLSSPGAFAGVSFELRKGEILGFAGLVGAGRTDVAQTLFGLRPCSGGQIELAGKSFTLGRPREAIARGLAYVPEDRKTVGLFLDMLLSDNMVVPQIYRFSRRGLLDDRDARRLTERYIERIGIVARGPRQKAMTLSGGNQQKLLLAMWLALEPQVLIVDEPTRGIDVGAKLEIHDLLRQLADGGMGILLISSELPEILTMSDRVAVMRDGRLITILPRAAANQQRILAIAAGVDQGGG